MRMHCVVSRRFTQHYLTLLPCFALHTAHYTRHTTHCTPHTSHHTPNTTHYTYIQYYTIIYIFWSEYHAFTFDVCARLSSEGQPDPLKQKLSLPQVMVICCNSHHTLDDLPYPVRQMSSAKLRKRISSVTLSAGRSWRRWFRHCLNMLKLDLSLFQGFQDLDKSVRSVSNSEVFAGLRLPIWPWPFIIFEPFHRYFWTVTRPWEDKKTRPSWWYT